MVENRGNATAYAGGTSHRPLPRATDGYRAAHQPQQAKKTTFDWGWNNATCTSCQTTTPKPQLLDGLCPGCRGETTANTIPVPVAPTELEHSKDGTQVYETYDNVELHARFSAPEHTPDPDPQPEPVQLPPHDGTRLGRELAELEATDPAVAASAAALDHVVDQITRPNDHVRPENLDVDHDVTDAASRAADILEAANIELAQPDDLIDLQCQHARRVLTRSATTGDPIVGILRSSVLGSIEALHLYLELHQHNQTPAASTSPRASAPRATATQPSPLGLGGDRPAAVPEGEAEQQPATFQTFQRPARQRPAPRGDIDEAAVVREYVEDHDSAPVIGRRHGCLPKRIRAILLRHGVELRDDRAGRSGGRNRRTYDQAVIERVARLYVEQQQSLDKIERATGIERRQVAKILRGAGITLRPPVNAAHVAPGEEANRVMVERYLDGESLAIVGAAFHVRQDYVRDLVTAAGHTIRAKGSSAQNAARVQQLGVTPAQVKAWALEQGLIDQIPHGLVSARLIDAYAAAHPHTPEQHQPNQSGDTTA